MSEPNRSWIAPLQDQTDAERCDRAPQVGLEHERRDDGVAERGDGEAGGDRQQQCRAPGELHEPAAREAEHQERGEPGRIAVSKIHHPGALEHHDQAERAECIEAAGDQPAPNEREQVAAELGEAHADPVCTISSSTTGKYRPPSPVSTVRW